MSALIFLFWVWLETIYFSFGTYEKVKKKFLNSCYLAIFGIWQIFFSLLERFLFYILELLFYWLALAIIISWLVSVIFTMMITSFFHLNYYSLAAFLFLLGTFLWVLGDDQYTFIYVNYILISNYCNYYPDRKRCPSDKLLYCWKKSVFIVHLPHHLSVSSVLFSYLWLLLILSFKSGCQWPSC